MPDFAVPEFTGERVVPGLVDVNLFNEHLSRYEFAKSFASGRRVLDAGCGSGYGAAALAEVAASVTGTDAAQDAIDYARRQYSIGHVHFEQGLVTALPGGPYDLITAFEVIEHLEDWHGFLKETTRVLTPGGLFLVSTPNRLYYAESRLGSGANPYHVHEFEFAEFERALLEVYPHVRMFVQNHAEAVVFTSLAPAETIEAALGTRLAKAEEAHFFVALCSLQPLAETGSFVWIPSDANVLRERERHIALQAGEIRMKTEWLAQQKAEFDSRNREYEELLGKVRELNAEMESRNAWALACQAEADRRGRIALEQQEEFARERADFHAIAAAYENKLAELEEINRAKTEWAWETERRLGSEIADRSRALAECVDILHAVERTVEERTEWAQRLDRELLEWQRRFDALRASTWVRAGSRLRLVDSR